MVTNYAIDLYYIARPLTNDKTKQDKDIIEVVSMKEEEEKEVVSLPHTLFFFLNYFNINCLSYLMENILH